VQRTVVVLRAMQFPVLAMLWALVLTIQRMVVLVGMQLLFTENKFFHRGKSDLRFLVFMSKLPCVRGESQIIPQFTNAEKFKQN
jgi:hypothetical protein